MSPSEAILFTILATISQLTCLCNVRPAFNLGDLSPIGIELLSGNGNFTCLLPNSTLFDRDNLEPSNVHISEGSGMLLRHFQSNW